MKKILFIALFFGASNLFAQQQKDSILVKEIPTIKNNVFKQRQEINSLTKKLNNQQYILNQQKKGLKTLNLKSEKQENIIDSLNQLIQTNSKNIVTNSTELGTKIKQTDDNANSKISELDSNLSKNRLYWIIATLATLILGGLVYWLLGRRIQSSKTDVETQIKNTKTALEEESVKLDNKLVEVLETQLKLKQEQTKVQPTTSNEKEDHSLALKVADEVIRIQKNLSRMDESTKGLKQLGSSVKRIQDNFASNGYELVEMIGKEYNEGMKVTANFTPSEDLETGKQIISRIIKPQVNFKGTMIQAAQIEVSVGE
ncbi:hypothetical protein [Polaribacter sp. 11A2H]|uniref:hypothetical protein n=1 Tax=Polaribacter sp. 11A2H TaxID=2687290 RepID=UPI001409F44C|nr:hypothetical protein [Polaribacter sp. 11A2H]